MGVASIVHLYVFPAKPYELMSNRFPRNISVLGDYASIDCPVDPDEAWESSRPTKLRLPQPDNDASGTSIRESVRDVVLGGGKYVSFLLLLLIIQSKTLLYLPFLLYKCASLIVHLEKDTGFLSFNCALVVSTLLPNLIDALVSLGCRI